MKTHELLSAVLILSLASGLTRAQSPSSSEPADPDEIRIPDLSTVLGGAVEPFIQVRPQGPLVYWSRSSPDPDLRRFSDENPPEQLDGSIPFESVSHEQIMGDFFPQFLRTVLDSMKVVDFLEMEDNILFRRGALFVRGPAHVQEAVEKIVAPLRVLSNRRYLIETLFVPEDLLDRLAPDWKEKDPLLEGGILEEALLDPRSRLLSVVALAGRWTNSSARDIQALVTDQEVNQTGVIPVANPVIETPPAGEHLYARALPIPGEKDIWCDIVWGRFRSKPQKASLGPQWSDLDLGVLAETLISTSTRLPVNRVLVAGSLDGKEGGVLLVRLRRQGKALDFKPLPPGAGPGRYLVTYDVSLLLRDSARRKWWKGEILGDLEDWDGDQLLEMITSMLGGEETWERNSLEYTNGIVFLNAPPDLHRKLEKLLQQELRRMSSQAGIFLELLELDRDSFVRLRARSEDGLLLTPDWREVIERKGPARDGEKPGSDPGRVYSLCAVAGESHALRIDELHSLPVDVENISGGTGFAIFQVADPVIDTCGEGTELRLRVDFEPGPDGEEMALLRLQGVDVKIQEIRSVETRYVTMLPTTAEQRSPRGSSSPGKNSFRQQSSEYIGAVEKIQLSLPRQSVQYLTVERQIPLDRDVILFSEAGQGKKARVLVGRVRKLDLTSGEK